MTCDVIVRKSGDTWFFEPLSDKARDRFIGIPPNTTCHKQALKLINQCSELGLFVQAPAFATYYQPPSLRRIKKNPTSPRHPVAGRPIWPARGEPYET